MPRRKLTGAAGLGTRITQLLSQKDLSTTELAAKTGISNSYLSRIISGQVTNPTIDFVKRIADGLNVPVDSLFEYEIKASIEVGASRHIPSLTRDAFRQFARNGRWGTCGECPRDSEANAYPEFCKYTNRYDHRLDIDQLASLFKTGS